MRVHGFDGHRLLCVSAGAAHSGVVQDGGAVVCFGSGRHARGLAVVQWLYVLGFSL
jgi:hypothetical protein